VISDNDHVYDNHRHFFYVAKNDEVPRIAPPEVGNQSTTIPSSVCLPVKWLKLQQR
jgi:hypothetical protein